MLKQCPVCKKTSVVEVPIGLTPTKERQGDLYIQKVCHNYECDYRDLEFSHYIEKIK